MFFSVLYMPFIYFNYDLFSDEEELQRYHELIKKVGEEMENNAYSIWDKSKVIKHTKSSCLVVSEPSTHNVRIEHYNWNFHRWVKANDMIFIPYMFQFCCCAQNLSWLFYPCCTLSRRQCVEAIMQGCYFSSQTLKKFQSEVLFEDIYRMINYNVRYVRASKEEPRGLYFENRSFHYVFINVDIIILLLHNHLCLLCNLNMNFFFFKYAF